MIYSQDNKEMQIIERSNSPNKSLHFRKVSSVL